MAEHGDGIFVSQIEADDWELDEETGGLVHFLRADDDVQAGLWKPGPLAGVPIDLTLTAHETFLVLDGSGQITVDGAAPCSSSRASWSRSARAQKRDGSSTRRSRSSGSTARARR